MKKYLPIRIFSIQYGYGWWFGKYFFFFGKKSTTFGIVPMYFHHHKCTYENGSAIERGMCNSWSEECQREKRKDDERGKKNV